MSYIDYADAGFHIFGLYGVTNGKCDCGNPDCKALYKHPTIRNWQNTPQFSQEQLDVMDDSGAFDTGHGVLVKNNLLVVDIDPRNGGDVSIKKLPTVSNKDCVVATGGGGWHRYYRIPPGVSLLTKHKDFKGIDFKTSGFVVGYGSLHASGNYYELEQGNLDNIQDCPQELLDKLIKPEYHRTEYDGQPVDVTDADIQELLGYISPDCDYDQWVRVGMVIHKITAGDGFDQWDKWSSTGEKYNASEMDSKWHSFGKSENTVGFGTLHHYAEQGGYKPSVTFDADGFDYTTSFIPKEVDESIDLARPPGLVGEVAKWMRSQCKYPRERLVVATALTTIGNLAGIKYKDSNDITTNLFSFCVAASATGKDDVLSSFSQIMRSAAAHGVNGNIKSEQEITRALIHGSAAFFAIDEVGHLLKKIKNAMTKGNASYLEGILAILMSVFSKADKYLSLNFDLVISTRKEIQTELASIQKRIDENEKYDEDRFEDLKQLLADIEFGLNKPFLSLIGFTTPVIFNEIIDYELATSGFLGRSLLIQEKETNPKIQKITKADLPLRLQITLSEIWSGSRRGQEKAVIPDTEDAKDMLNDVYEYFHEYSEEQKKTGLEAVSRRGYELVLKISLILAIGEGVRTVEHVKWAFEYIKADIGAKINLAAANIAESYKDSEEELGRKIINLLDENDGLQQSVIANRLRKFRKDDVYSMIDRLIENNQAKRVTVKPTGRGRPSERIFLKKTN